MSVVDSQLYRPLQSGAAFEGLIPAYKGIDKALDRKKDNHNTYDTLRFMANWATKYASQMSKVAPLLKGKTVTETVNNIYSFLYNHFQYKLDGAMQNLYSPSAAWHFRKTGFDCKTYSILASTILQNLNIPHAFRMVQQAGIMPGEWSHVYVIVPNGNSHYVIDATTHTNNEVSFTKKYDYAMQHRGLAQPFIADKFTGLGCACQGKPISQTGLGSPAVMANTVRNFHSFLDVLEANGISREVTNRMLAMVKWNLDNGIDPNMSEILRKSLSAAPQQGLGVIEPISSLSSVGGTYGDMSYGTPTYAATATATSGGSLLNTGISALSNVSVGGVNVVDTGTQLLNGNFVGAGLNVLNKVFDFNGTFGAIFANGFDLTCWGSGYSESQAKKDIEKDLPFMLNFSGVYTAATTENLDKFQWITQAYINNAISGQRDVFVKCTRKGHALLQKAAEEFRKNIYAEFTKNGFQLIPAGKKKGINIPVNMPGKQSGNSYSRWANADTEFDSYTVISPQQIAAQKAAEEAAAKANAANTATSTTTEKKSNLGTLVTVGSAIVLGAKLLL